MNISFTAPRGRRPCLDGPLVLDAAIGMRRNAWVGQECVCRSIGLRKRGLGVATGLITFHSILSQIPKLSNVEIAGKSSLCNLITRHMSRVLPSTQPWHTPCATATMARAPSSPKCVTANNVRSHTHTHTYYSSLHSRTVAAARGAKDFGEHVVVR